MIVGTEFTLPTMSFQITHEPTTGDPGRTGAGLSITEEGTAPNTLTTISAGQGEHTLNIYVLWERPQSMGIPRLHLLFVPETSILFIGGGQFSASVDIQNRRLIRQHYVLLFWAYQFSRNAILELGEIECFLYGKDGVLLGEAPVDPPYDIVEHESHIEFISSIFGSQSIRYPT